MNERTPMARAGSCLAWVIVLIAGWLLILAVVLISILAIRAIT